MLRCLKVLVKVREGWWKDHFHLDQRSLLLKNEISVFLSHIISDFMFIHLTATGFVHPQSTSYNPYWSIKILHMFRTSTLVNDGILVEFIALLQLTMPRLPP